MYHYVYQITDLQRHQYYVGSRSSELRPDLDLGKIYFSSSTNKRFLDEQQKSPENFEYDILETFSSYEKALEYENHLLKEYNARQNKHFINGITKHSFNTVNSRATKDTVKYLGDLIRIARKERGITQQELADRVGVSRGLIRRLEGGNTKIQIGAAFEACFVLGIPLMGCNKEHINSLARMLSYINKLIPINTPSKNINFNDDF